MINCWHHLLLFTHANSSRTGIVASYEALALGHVPPPRLCVKFCLYSKNVFNAHIATVARNSQMLKSRNVLCANSRRQVRKETANRTAVSYGGNGVTARMVAAISKSVPYTGKGFSSPEKKCCKPHLNRPRNTNTISC